MLDTRRAHRESELRPPQLSTEQRSALFDKVTRIVSERYYDPGFNGTDWPRRAQEERDRIVAVADPDEFELNLHNLVRSLGTSHTGFFHQSVRRIPSRLAIAATFHKTDMPSGAVWFAQDVHEGGPANRAGLRPGDQLTAIQDRQVETADQLTFAMGTSASVDVKRDECALRFNIDIAAPRSRKQPHAVMKAVTVSRMKENIGYLKIPVLPGMFGLDVARQIDAAMSELADCDGLVLDLRGHIGGGLGVLRLMSHLTAGKVPIGYTVTRKRAEKGFEQGDLPKLDRLPTQLPNPLAIGSLALKFAGRDHSVALVSEGLGAKGWHGRMAVLINEHTISAGEMVAAFVRDNGLGTLVGSKTAGRLVPASGRKVGHGYVVVIPGAYYATWSGSKIEEVGVTPHIEVAWAPGADTQMAAATACVR